MVLHQEAFCCTLALRAVSYLGGKHQLLEFRCGSLRVVGGAASPQCSFCTSPAPSSGLFHVLFEVFLQQAPSCWPLARVMTDSKGEGCLKKGLPVARSLIDWFLSRLPSHWWCDLNAVNTFPRDRVFIAYCLSIFPVIRPDYRIGMRIKAIMYYFLWKATQMGKAAHHLQMAEIKPVAWGGFPLLCFTEGSNNSCCFFGLLNPKFQSRLVLNFIMRQDVSRNRGFLHILIDLNLG